MSALRGARALRTLGIRRNETSHPLAAVAWRCAVHHRLNHPDYPAFGCGCPSPLEAAVLKDDAELAACRQLRIDDQFGVLARGPLRGRERKLDYGAILAMAGSTVEVARHFKCSPEMVSRLRRSRP